MARFALKGGDASVRAYLWRWFKLTLVVVICMAIYLAVLFAATVYLVFVINIGAPHRNVRTLEYPGGRAVAASKARDMVEDQGPPFSPGEAAQPPRPAPQPPFRNRSPARLTSPSPFVAATTRHAARRRSLAAIVPIRGLMCRLMRASSISTVAGRSERLNLYFL